jgi:ribosomal protein S18 acetylase RimI-like enzyme
MVGDWVLNDLFVASGARRQGVAAALLEAAAVHARALGVSSLSLTTGRDNQAAQALYESLGWQRDDHFYSYALTL